MKLLRRKRIYRKEVKAKMKSSTKILLLIPAVLVLLLGLAGTAYAGIDCNLTVPSVVNKLTELNVSFNISGVVTNNVTVSIEAKSASTDNSSYGLIFNGTNMSTTQYTNFTLGDNVVLIDSDDYVFKATCTLNQSVDTGGTHTGDSSEVTGRVLDRSKAQINGITNLGNSLTSTGHSVSFGIINGTSWIFYDGNNQIVQRDTSITGKLTNQSYTVTWFTGASGSYYITAADGTATGSNTTTSATKSYTMIGEDDDDREQREARIAKHKRQLEAKDRQSKGKSFFFLALFGILGLAFLLGMLMLALKYSKKK
tara:strand:- start:347 stop:1279 length:933 start_codon:yes stop_codon:yes gene_type:complete